MTFRGLLSTAGFIFMRMISRFITVLVFRIYKTVLMRSTEICSRYMNGQRLMDCSWIRKRAQSYWYIDINKKLTNGTTILERGLPICGLRPHHITMHENKSMTLPTPHIGYSRHGLFFKRLDCQSNAKPFEKNHDILRSRIRDLSMQSWYFASYLVDRC
jgi:hypothetical protein